MTKANQTASLSESPFLLFSFGYSSGHPENSSATFKSPVDMLESDNPVCNSNKHHTKTQVELLISTQEQHSFMDKEKIETQGGG